MIKVKTKIVKKLISKVNHLIRTKFIHTLSSKIKNNTY